MTPCGADTRYTTKACEAWLATPEGEYARAGISRILSHLISDWPRRGRRLLHTNCGSGRISELFWEAGFDVTAVTADPELMQETRDYMGPRADVQLAAPDCLPYDDNSFEFVAIPFLCCKNENLEGSLREAIRVASKGVLTGFFNSWSLYGASKQLAKNGIVSMSPVRIYRLLHAIDFSEKSTTMTFRSVLSGPAYTWRSVSIFRVFNEAVLPHPFGAYAVFRLDCGAQQTRTPIGLRTSLLTTQRQNACFLLKR